MASRIEALHETSGPIAMIKETYIRLDGGEIPVEVTAVPTTFKGKPGAHRLRPRGGAARGEPGGSW